ncbi:MAG: hypothetical protein HUU10_06495 [Bacteroidetes bacterium]|nr:hypothetical protein [Bacteroidota bacterium]
MKKLLWLPILLLSFGLTSCEESTSSDDDNGGGGGTQIGAGVVSAKIGSESWTSNSGASYAYAAYNNEWLVIYGQSYKVEGTTVKQKQISLSIYQPKTGTRSVGVETGTVYATLTVTEGSNTKIYVSYKENSGTINMTKWDTSGKIASGTFSFDATEGGDPNGTVISVTNGSFDVKYNQFTKK